MAPGGSTDDKDYQNVNRVAWLHSAGMAWLTPLIAATLFLPGLPIPSGRVVVVGIASSVLAVLTALLSRRRSEHEPRLAAFSVGVLLLVSYSPVSAVAGVTPYSAEDRWGSLAWIVLVSFAVTCILRRPTRSLFRASLLVIAMVTSLSLALQRGWIEYLLQPEVMSYEEAVTLTTPPTLSVHKDDDPDILHIIADGLAGRDVLSQAGVNTDDMQPLFTAGLTIVDGARANYSHTYQSVASTLNSAYLDILTKPLLHRRDRRPYRDLVGHSSVFAALRKRGYAIRVLESGFDLFGAGSDAVNCESCGAGFPNLFELALNAVLPTRGLIPQRIFYDAHRARVERAVEVAAGLDWPSQRPTATLLHLLAPHPPFVFTTQPVRRDERPYSLLDSFLPAEHHQAYLKSYGEQVRWTIRQLARVAVAARRSSSRRLIVIIHGDHGPGFRFDPEGPDSRGVADRFSILLALSLPFGLEGTTPTSPVNIYRTLFRQLYGARTVDLPDRQFITDGNFPFRFTDVTADDECTARR